VISANVIWEKNIKANEKKGKEIKGNNLQEKVRNKRENRS
jgi:hypothetical protein